MYKLVDLRNLDWDTNPTNTNGTGGTYLKAISGSGTDRLYYKLSNYDSFLGQTIGYEAVFELIAYRLAKLLGLNCLKYNLVRALINVQGAEQESYICISKEFKKHNERKITLEDCYNIKSGHNESLFNFIDRIGIRRQIDEMMLFDFLIINRDRHGANIELLKSPEGIRMTPLFDNGLALIAPLGQNLDSIKAFRADTDVTANNYIGSRSLQYNLSLISTPVIVNKLNFNTLKRQLFYNLSEVLPKEVRDKIYEIITVRYRYAINQKVLVTR